MKTFEFYNEVYYPTVVKAQRMEITQNGELLFLDGDILLAAIAPGYWIRSAEVTKESEVSEQRQDEKN